MSKPPTPDEILNRYDAIIMQNQPVFHFGVNTYINKKALKKCRDILMEEYKKEFNITTGADN